MILFAPNIHTGGGKVLLFSILKHIDFDCTIFIDSRLDLSNSNFNNKIKFRVVKNNVISRLFAEVKLFFFVKKTDSVFCFSSLPPLFRSNGFVTVFFQNNILLPKFSYFKFSKSTQFKHIVERMWFKIFFRNANQYIVQTNTVKKHLLSEHCEAQIIVAPFFDFSDIDHNDLSKKISNKSFIYVSSSDPHKNHENLFLAWKILNHKNISPHLTVTLSENEIDPIFQSFKKLQNDGLNVSNSGSLSREKVFDLYQKSNCLIFPSLTESFGLPLVEALKFGLDIIASDLDYVFEVLDPIFVFDPLSPESIAEAVEKYLTYANNHQKKNKVLLKLNILTSENFVNKFIKRN